MSYGSRARIGYTCPIYLAEIFPYDFYRMVPDGVSLMTATASVWRGTPEEMRKSAEESMRAAREMARSGVNIIVFGGVPVGFAAGFPSIEELVQSLEAETGVPTTASLLCQNHALQAVGAKKVVVLRTGEGRRDQHMDQVEKLGCTILDVRGVGEGMYATPPPAEHTLELARAILRDNPDADTLHCPSPHWPMAANIQQLEDEFHVNVITAGQAIVWESLRRCNIADPIPRYGRLLREL
jgi:maleate isomerase